MSKTKKNSEIVHIITGLEDGGAEGALFRLVSSTPTENHTVISLSGSGKYGSRLREMMVPTYYLNLNSKISACKGICKLFSILNQKDRKNTVIQTWMYHSDLLGGIAAWLLGHRKILWGIRQTSIHHGKKTTRIVAKLCAHFSHLVPSAIISCSHAAKTYHQKIGYKNKFHVIPNGYLMDELRPNSELGKDTRTRLGIEQQGLLVMGCVASWKPFKDHKLLLTSIAHWSEKNPDLDYQLLLVGKNCDKKNQELIELISEHNLEQRIHLLGPQADICAIMNAIDLHVLASKSEGFPNVVAEAMACGTPCLATDVGDAAVIIGDTGWIVRPESESCLVQGLSEATTVLLSDAHNYEALSTLCRQRIEQNYSMQNMSNSFQGVWQEVLEL